MRRIWRGSPCRSAASAPAPSSLGGRGDLRDWEIMNRPAKGFIPTRGSSGPFFAIFVKDAKGQTQARGLEGPIDPALYEDASGSGAVNHGLPRFRRCTFAAAYPLGQVRLLDPDVPVDRDVAGVQSAGPRGPQHQRHPGGHPAIRDPEHHQSAASSLGLRRPAQLHRQRRLRPDQRLGRRSHRRRRQGQPQRIPRGQGRPRHVPVVRGSRPESSALGHDRPDDPDARARSRIESTGSPAAGAASSLDFWDDFSADGKLEERELGKEDTPMASLAVSVEVPAKQTVPVVFLLTWHFPNRMTWTPKNDATGPHRQLLHDPVRGRLGRRGEGRAAGGRSGRRDAPIRPGVLRQPICPRWSRRRRCSTSARCGSQTCFRTEDGRFFGLEGCGNRGGCCHGSCTHVWNYEQPPPCCSAAWPA